MELINALFQEEEIINIRLIEQIDKKEKKTIINLFVKKDENVNEKLKEIIKEYNSKYNVYFGVNPRKGEHNSHISRISSLYIDIDEKTFATKEAFEENITVLNERLKEYNLTPNFEIFSGYGVHYYWLIDEKEKDQFLWIEKGRNGKKEKFQESKKHRDIEEALICLSEADKAVKDLPRILRLPGSENIKNLPEKILVTEKENGKKPYRFKDFSIVLKEYKEQKRILAEEEKRRKEEQEKVNNAYAEYEKKAEFIDENNIKQIVIDTLAEIDDFPKTYEDMLKLGMAFKSEDLKYAEIDKVYKNKYPHYNYEISESKYNEIVPMPRKITFGTAFFYAKKLNPIMLQTLLKNAPKKEIGKDAQFKEENDKVFYFVESKNGIVKKEAANFIMRITKSIKNDDNESSFELKIKSKNAACSFEIEGSGFPVLNDFRKELGKQGLYLISIKDIDIYNQYLQFVYEKSTTESIKKTNFLGRVGKKTYLMEDCTITENGQQELTNLFPDLPSSQNKKMTYKKENPFDLSRFVQDMNAIFGIQTYKYIGFLVSTLFSAEIFNHYNFFPLLFLYGKSESGKSTIANFAQACFGTQNITPPFTINSTPKSIQRTMSRFFNTPVQYNEYKPSEKTNNLLISIFDREAYSRAVKDNSNKTITNEVNASMIFLGTYGIAGYKAEDLTNRTVELNFNNIQQKKEIIDFWEENINNMIGFVEFCIKNINAGELLKSIKVNIKDAKKQYNNSGRILENHCILQASYNYLLEKLEIIETLGISNIKDDIETQQNITKDNQVAEFALNIIENLYARKDIFDNRIVKEGNILYFDLKNIYINILKEAKQAGIDFPDKRTLATSLTMKGLKQKTKRDGNKVKKYWVYETELEEKEAPEWYNEYDKKMMEV
uniref:DUF927 domain-containing protein n=3 Tax=viral metagenome TaxID=1070528 RepID=A0A6M3XW86_9ZZZZ